MNEKSICFWKVFTFCYSIRSDKVLGIPFYNYDPLTIQVGRFSEQLLQENPVSLLKLADRITA